MIKPNHPSNASVSSLSSSSSSFTIPPCRRWFLCLFAPLLVCMELIQWKLFLAMNDSILSSSSSVSSRQVQSSSSSLSSSVPPTTTTTTTKPDIVVDMLSIGSIHQADLQQAQYETFGSQARQFYAATGADDVEHACHTNLTWTQVERIVQQCRSARRKAYPLHSIFKRFYARRQWLQKKANPTAWMCAQKRPLQALRNMVLQYYSLSSSHDDESTDSNQPRSTHGLEVNASLLPDYLIVGDDDTWMNWPAVQATLPQLYPSHEPRAVAACLVRWGPHSDHFTFPFGGYGIVLTRPVLWNLLRPLNCSKFHASSSSSPRESKPPFSHPDDFEALVCWRLQQNGIGEQAFYRPGSSLLDILYDYSVVAPYLSQKRQHSFCLHSDWVWGYLFNYHHMAWHSNHHHHSEQKQDGDMHSHNHHHNTNTKTPALPDSYNRTVLSLVLHDRLEGYNQSQYLTLPGSQSDGTLQWLRECRHSPDFGSLFPPPTVTPQQTASWQQFWQQQPTNHTTKSNRSPGDVYCTPEAHFCHRVSPSYMRYLHHLQQQQLPPQ